MTSLTVLTLAVVVYGVLNRHGYGRALALGGSTAAGAAVVAGGTAVPTFYATAVGAAVALALSLLPDRRRPPQERRRLPPGVALLVAFLAWSTFVTLAAPQLFAGTSVISSGVLSELRPGVLTSSNVAQIVYLFLGVCVVLFLARSPHSGPELIGIVVGLATLLSFWRYLSTVIGVPFPEGVFDNSPSFNYIETAPGDVQRFRGILSEPAGLAIGSLVTISYMLSRAVQVRGRRRIGAIAVAVAAGIMGTISTSATFLVAGGIVIVVAGFTFALAFLFRRTSVSVGAGVSTCAFVIIALFLLPVVFNFVEAAVDEKVSSSSFDDRSTSDAVSYDVFLNTYGLGAGLGSARPSSFLPALLSTTGVIGTLLFGAAVAGLVFRTAPVRQYRPVVWALVTLVIVKVVSSPDLSDSSGVLWMSLGLLARAAQDPQARRPSMSPVAVPSTVRGTPARP